MIGGEPISGGPISAAPWVAAGGGGGFQSAWTVGPNAILQPAGFSQMRKNVASQKIGAQLVNATDGSAFTGSVTVAVTGDAGTQATGSVGSGACTHEGNGYHTYAPAQAETNYDLIAFTFTGTGAVPATVQVFTTSLNPHDTVRAGLTALPNAAADAAGGLPISYAGGLDLDAKVGALTFGTANRVNAQVYGNEANVITAASIAADAITDAKVASDVTIASVTGAVGSVTGNVGGNVTGSVGSVATGGITSASFAAGAITAAAVAADAIGASELAADAVAEIADAVWDEVLSGHLTGGSTGNALNAAGSAGDPWSTALPGAYSAGSAGYIIGTNLDAAVSSRGTSTLTQTQVTGGAYALNSASFAFNSALDFTTTQKAATLARVTLTDTVTTYTGNTPQTGDSFARIGATGSGLTSLAPSATALSTAVWTAPPTGFLAATFPTTVASTTNITAGTITTVSGAVGSVTGAVGSVLGGINTTAGTITTLDALDTAQDTQHGTTQTAVGTKPTLAQILAGGDVDGYTLEQTLKLCLAALTGKLSGAATTTVTIRSAADDANRIVATVDADGNRSAVTLNAAG